MLDAAALFWDPSIQTHMAIPLRYSSLKGKRHTGDNPTAAIVNCIHPHVYIDGQCYTQENYSNPIDLKPNGDLMQQHR